MLLHKACGAPVDVLEDEMKDGSGDVLSMLRWYCQICREEVFDDHELEVVDSLRQLKEIM